MKALITTEDMKRHLEGEGDTMTQALITTEHVQRQLDAWEHYSPGYGFASADNTLLAQHLAGNLAMIAQYRADKRLEAAEGLVDAVIRARDHATTHPTLACSFCQTKWNEVHDWGCWVGILKIALGNYEATLAAYEEAAPGPKVGED